MNLSRWILGAWALVLQVNLASAQVNEVPALPESPQAVAAAPADNAPKQPAEPAKALAAPAVNCCNPPCEEKCPHGIPIAEIGGMILTPKWKENPALYFVNQIPFTTNPGTSSQQNFSFHSQFVPQASLGWISAGGLGFRSGWWGFASGSREAGTSSGPDAIVIAASPLQVAELSDPVEARAPGQFVEARAVLRMDVWNFEALRVFGSDQWWALASGGIRYAHVSQEYNAVKFGAGGMSGLPFGPRNFVLSGHNFNGAGPTVGLEADWLLGGTGLYLYGKTRGSFLFGASKQSANFANAAAGGGAQGGGQVIPWFASERSNSIVPEGELELGLGFEREIRRVVVFLQAGLVGQAWGNIGSSSESSGIPPRAQLGGNESSTPNRDGTLGLIGFTVQTGIGY
jgi:hypothetical protein